MAQTQHREPLKSSGSLDKFAFEETTPLLGREFINVDLFKDVLQAENADDMIRDLAITVSERGVVFFRAQDNLSNDLQKELMHRMGQLSGKPDTSKLHIFPLAPAFLPASSTKDKEISYVNSVGFKYMFDKMPNMDKRHFDAAQWHSDIQFEPVPADYTSLRLIELPTTGGDTLWASGYELYDRLSETFKAFVKPMTITCRADCLLMAMQRRGEQIEEGERGSPLNVGRGLTSIHPLVRTHPITGWNTLFGVGQFSKTINELNVVESDELLKKFYGMIQDNHDMQCRFRWRNPNDIAIWDNRCTFHRATFDYLGLGDRYGNRAVGIGEVPYFDAEGVSRAEALGLKAPAPPPTTVKAASGHSHGHGMSHGHGTMGHGGMNHGGMSHAGMSHGSHGANGAQSNGAHTNGAATNGAHTNGGHTNGDQTNGHTNGSHTNGHTNGDHTETKHTNGNSSLDENNPIAEATNGNGTTPEAIETETASIDPAVEAPDNIAIREAPKVEEAKAVEPTPEAVSEAVQDHTYKFSVFMPCDNCSNLIDGLLQKLDGVKSHEVSLEKQLVTVVTESLTYDDVLRTIAKSEKKIKTGEADGQARSVEISIQA